MAKSQRGAKDAEVVTGMLKGINFDVLCAALVMPVLVTVSPVTLVVPQVQADLVRRFGLMTRDQMRADPDLVRQVLRSHVTDRAG